ncbi:MAG: BolA family transcriptional regulator [Bradymonadales bacterium]|nr:MAG: BolA family transcriptional regulator [Bradymonadales bacterium]
MKAQEIQDRLREALPGASIEVWELGNGEADSFELRLLAPQFQGKSLVQQHQMIYQILGDKMKDEIHALKITSAAL